MGTLRRLIIVAILLCCGVAAWLRKELLMELNKLRSLEATLVRNYFPLAVVYQRVTDRGEV